MSNITASQYWKEVSAVASSVVAEAMQYSDNDRDSAEFEINDRILHETIDGHEWIIYNAYNLDVIQNSDNAEYFIDNFGSESAGMILKENGLAQLHAVIAFWAFYQDVAERLDMAFDEYEESQEPQDD